MVKAAVIGLGAMGKNHARVYNDIGILAGVCDNNESSAAELAKKYNLPAFTSLEVMLESVKPDIASIAVPTPYHKEVALKCLNAGVDILVEKPLSYDIATAKDILDVAKKNNRILGVGYIEKYNPAFQALNALVKDGVFGEITSVNIKRVGGIPRTAKNVILDLMTHDFGLLIELFGCLPSSINSHKRFDDGVLDSAQVLLDFGSASATCEANWVSPVKIREIHLTGTRGYCEVDLIKQQVTRISSPPLQTEGGAYTSFIKGTAIQQYRDVVTFQVEPLRAEIEAFVKAASARNAGEIVTGDKAIEILEVTLQAAVAQEALPLETFR